MVYQSDPNCWSLLHWADLVAGVEFLIRFPEIPPTVVVPTPPVLVLFDLVLVSGMEVAVEGTTVEKGVNLHFARCSDLQQRTHLFTPRDGGADRRT